MKTISSIIMTLTALTVGLVRLPAQQAETNSFTGVNLAVPDGNGSGLSLSTNLSSQIATVSAVRVRLNVTGNFNGDLYAYLRHQTDQATNICVLLNRPGRTSGNSAGYDHTGLNIGLADGAVSDIHLYGAITNPPAGAPLEGDWQPDGRLINPYAVLDTDARTTSLANFTGMAASGEWTLFIADLEKGGTNLLVEWHLEIMGPAIPPVTWPAPADIVYGTALGGSQLNASSTVAGTFAYTPTSGTVLDAGNSQVLTAVFTPTDMVNYVKTTNTVTINVLQKDLTITADDKTKVYGAALPTLTASYDGFVNGDTSASLTTQPTVGTVASAGSPVGDYPITASGAASPNYNISYVAGNLSVTAASLTIAADDKTKVYGAALPTFTASYDGFVNGDTSASLTSQPTLGTTASASSPVGDYPITASGAASPNYSISYVQGTLSITKASLTGIVASSLNPAQPGQTVTLSYSLSPVAPGAGNPSGSVTFKVDGASAGTGSLAGSVAEYATDALAFGSHSIVAEYSGDGNFHGVTNELGVQQIINTPPTGVADSLTRPLTNGVKVQITTLLANDSDADSGAGDVISFLSFSTNSARGGLVTRSNGWLFFKAAAGDTETDTFTYVIGDTLGASNSVTVTVVPEPDNGSTMNLRILPLGGGLNKIQFDGIPNASYSIEFADTLPATSWNSLTTTNADANGMFSITDTNGPPSRYYRSVYR